MKNKLFIITLVLCGGLFADLKLDNSDAGLAVGNSYYQLFFSSKGNYAASSLEVQGVTYSLDSGPEFVLNGETEKYIRQAPGLHYRTKVSKAQEKSCKVVASSAKNAEVEFSWKYTNGNITLNMKFDESPRIDCRMTSNFSVRVADLFYTLLWAPKAGSTGNVILPENRKAASPSRWSYFTPAPAWKYFVPAGQDRGVGLLTGNGCQGIEFYLNEVSDGFGYDEGVIRATYTRPRDMAPGEKAIMDFVLLVGASKELVASETEGKMPSLWISEVKTDLLAVKPGESNRLLATVVNHSKQDAKVQLAAGMRYKITGEKLAVSEDTVLKAMEYRNLEFSLPTEVSMQGGAAAFLRLLVDGKVVAERETSFAIDDWAPRSVKCANVNAAICHQPGSEDTWREFLQHQKIGVMEYYLWMHSCVNGLAPQVDEWRPHTESNSYYRYIIRKDFVRNLIGNFHKHGMKIVSTITGLHNFKAGLENPENLIYCENGQPCIYNGSIINDERVATFKVNGYTPEFVKNWAKEANDSMDMFGWDGWRFDWYFIPDAPNDPLYLNEVGPDWRDFRGRKGGELYPEPDKTAVELLGIWREAVEAKHPGFIYATNIHANEKSNKRNPGYLEAVSKHSMLLFEYMIALNNPTMNTFTKWSTLLSEDVQRVRPGAAQPKVGFAPTFPSDSVSGNLMQYLCFASGAKTEGTITNPRDNMVRGEFMVRYSEYYFDPSFRSIPAEEKTNRFQLGGVNGRVFYEPFTCSRTLADGSREETLHLINLPREDYFYQYHERPQIQRNVQIAVTPRPGEKLDAAYAMLPNPVPHSIRLEISGTKVLLPELEDAAIVLLKYQ